MCIDYFWCFSWVQSYVSQCYGSSPLHILIRHCKNNDKYCWSSLIHIYKTKSVNISNMMLHVCCYFCMYKQAQLQNLSTEAAVEAGLEYSEVTEWQYTVINVYLYQYYRMYSNNIMISMHVWHYAYDILIMSMVHVHVLEHVMYISSNLTLLYHLRTNISCSLNIKYSCSHVHVLPCNSV